MSLLPADPLTTLNPMTLWTDPQDFEFDPLGSATVILSAEAVEWALQICQPITDADQQWTIFLRAMALQGLQQWLA
ncbi:DUF1822 family protein, partial [Haemophilus parainfluenzae]|uniref:DUF1822 family protein n=1 Tax=Haemophilus parainfluenzae TaxID=729 RepID=UPI00157F3B99